MELSRGIKSLNAAGAKAASNLSTKEILKNLSISEKTIDAILASAGKVDLAKLPISAKEKEILGKLDLSKIDGLGTKEGAAKLFAMVSEKMKKGEIASCAH